MRGYGAVIFEFYYYRDNLLAESKACEDKLNNAITSSIFMAKSSFHEISFRISMQSEGHSPSAEGQTACHVAQLDGAAWDGYLSGHFVQGIFLAKLATHFMDQVQRGCRISNVFARR